MRILITYSQITSQVNDKLAVNFSTMTFKPSQLCRLSHSVDRAFDRLSFAAAGFCVHSLATSSTLPVRNFLDLCVSFFVVGDTVLTKKVSTADPGVFGDVIRTLKPLIDLWGLVSWKRLGSTRVGSVFLGSNGRFCCSSSKRWVQVNATV